MYDEIDIVKETITNLRKYDCKIIVIQSDPGNKEMILDGSICDKYEKMSDIAGNREEYAKIIEEKNHPTMFSALGAPGRSRKINKYIQGKVRFSIVPSLAETSDGF